MKGKTIITITIILSLIFAAIVFLAIYENQKIIRKCHDDYGVGCQEQKCKEACGEKYFYSYNMGGIFSSSTETCTCGS